MRVSFFSVLGALLCGAAMAACNGGASSTGGTAGTGTSAMGGSGPGGSTTGGSMSTGGNTSTGGGTSAGGSTSSGGTAGTGGAGGTGGGIDAAQACEQQANAVCGKLDACFTAGIVTGYGDEATCVALAKAACVARLGLDGVTATPGDIAACAAAYGAISCEGVFGEGPDACKLHGTRPDGASCSIYLQCASGLCLGNKNGCGQCGKALALGDACDPSDVSASCGAGHYCDAATKQCVKIGAQGDPCKSSATCNYALTCIGGKCDTPLPEGAACSPNAGECDYVKSGLLCSSITMKCTAIHVAAVGESCATDPATSLITACKGPAYCDPATVKCTADIADGAACDPAKSYQCMPYDRCDGTCTLTPACN